MRPASAYLLVGLLGVGLWAAWFLPPFLRPTSLPAGGELAALWGVHMLPLAALLLAPLVGLETSALFTFPTALVLPFAGAAAFDWPLGATREGADLALGAAAFLLYAIAAPLALRRSRVPRAGGEVRALRRRGVDQLDRGLAVARAGFAALLPLCMAYAAHFDAHLQLGLRDSFADSAGYAAVLIDLCALALAIVAADLAFFSPLRALRGRVQAAEVALEIEEAWDARTAPRGSASAALIAAGLLFVALAAYLAVKP